jgi:hypothetical protein
VSTVLPAGQTSFLFTPIYNGNWRWQVRSMRSDGQPGDAPHTRSFRVESPDGVQLCDGVNYGGECRTYTAGRHMNLGDWSDRAESVRFRGSYVGTAHLRLNADTDLNGDVYHTDNDVPDLGGAFRNRISSMEITFDDGIQVCDGPNYTSGCVTLKEGRYMNLADHFGGWSDKIESMRFVGDYVGRYRVRFNVDTDLRGDGYASNTNVASFPQHLRNSISSAEITREAPTGCVIGTDGIALYVDGNFNIENGRFKEDAGCLFVTSDMPNLRTFGFDRVISSLRFVGSFRSTTEILLFSSPDFQNLCGSYWQDQNILGACVDQAQSIRILPFTAPTPIPTPPGTVFSGNVAPHAYIDPAGTEAIVDGSLSSAWVGVPAGPLGTNTVTMSWAAPVTINRITLWDLEPSPTGGSIYRAMLAFSDGTVAHEIELGLCRVVTFPAREVAWLKIIPSDTSDPPHLLGLREVEVWATTGPQFSDNSCSDTQAVVPQPGSIAPPSVTATALPSVTPTPSPVPVTPVEVQNVAASSVENLGDIFAGTTGEFMINAHNPGEPDTLTTWSWEVFDDSGGKIGDLSLEGYGVSMASGPLGLALYRTIPADLPPGVYRFVGSVTTEGRRDSQTATFMVAADTTGPTVSLNAPAAGSALVDGAAIEIAADDGSGAGLTEIEVRYCPGSECVFGEGISVGAGSAAPFTFPWNDQPPDGAYTLVARATDRVGNRTLSAPVTVEVANDPSPPSGPALTLDEDDPGAHVRNGRLYFNSERPGTFSVTAETDDPDSTIAEVAFPAVFGGDGGTSLAAPYAHAYAWPAGASASGAFEVTARNGVGRSATASFDVAPDGAGPAVAIDAAGLPARISEGQAIALTADDGQGAGVRAVEVRVCAGQTCDFTAGTPVGIDDAAPFAVTWTEQPVFGDYTLVARAADRVGNTADSSAVTVLVANDASAPSAPVLTIAEEGVASHRRGETVFYNPAAGNAGAITVRATAEDAESGIARVAFPELFGNDAAADAEPAFEHVYTWDAADTAEGEFAVEATNGAGGASRTSFAVRRDQTSPSVTFTAPASGAVLTAGAVIDVAADDGAGAGVAAVELWWCAGDTCPVATGTPLGRDDEAPFAVAWTDQPTDGIYTLIARATDRVGNRADSAPVTVLVANDTSAPNAPVLTLAEDEPDAFVVGTQLIYNPGAGHEGAFTVRAEASDPDSGIATVTFPVVFGGDGVEDAEAPYERTYTWAAGATAGGAHPVSAANPAGLAASADFTLTPDADAPSVAITGPGDAAPLAEGAVIDVDAADPVAGIAAVEVRFCPGTTCSFESGTAIGSDDTAPYRVTWTGLPTPGRYTLVARATDRVGNSRDSAPVTVRVGNHLPDGLSAGGPYAVAEGGSVDLAAAATDPDGDDLAFAWDLDGDGSFETDGQQATFSAAGRDGPGSRAVTARACDSLGLCTTADATVAITNLPPAIAGVANSGPTIAGGSATISVTAADPAGANDPLTYAFDCANDGQFEIGPQAQPSAACAFPTAGSRTVAVRVGDGDGGVATGSTTVVVGVAALAVSCTATESQTAAVAKAACDGNLATIWSSKRDNTAGENASVTFDLGAPGRDGPHRIGELRWQFSQACCDTLTIQISTDGKTFKTFAKPNAKAPPDTWQPLAGPTQAVEKVRFVFAAKKAKQVGFVREVEFCKQTCPVAASQAAGVQAAAAREAVRSDEPAADPAIVPGAAEDRPVSPPASSGMGDGQQEASPSEDPTDPPPGPQPSAAPESSANDAADPGAATPTAVAAPEQDGATASATGEREPRRDGDKKNRGRDKAKDGKQKKGKADKERDGHKAKKKKRVDGRGNGRQRRGAESMPRAVAESAADQPPDDEAPLRPDDGAERPQPTETAGDDGGAAAAPNAGILPRSRFLFGMAWH